MERYLLSAMALLLICGCLGQAQQQAPQAPQNQTPALPAQSPQWDHFSGSGMSFDYPHGMAVNVSNATMPQSSSVLIQSSDAAKGAIIIDFVNVTKAVSGNEDPASLVSGVLEYENSSGSDALLSQAYDTGNISTYATPGGLTAAEMPFLMVSGNVTLYGYAIDLLDLQGKSSYPVRILSSDPDQSRAIRDRLIATFRSG